MTGSDRHFVDILMAAREYGLEAVEAACAKALAAGTSTTAVVLNLLARQITPVADCARYDTLLLETCHGTA